MIRLFAIVFKELHLLLRDPGGLLLLFVLPSIFILVLSVALQGAFSSMENDEKLDILIVNLDPGDFGAGLVESVDTNGHFRTVTSLDGNPLTRERAIEEVTAGSFQLAMIIPAKSEEALLYEEDAVVELIIDPILSRQFTNALTGAVRSFIHYSLLARYMAESNAKSEVIDELAGSLEQLGHMFKAPRSEPDSGVDGPDFWPAFETDFPLELQPKYAIQKRGLQVESNRVTEIADDPSPNTVQQNVPGWTIFALFWIAQILALNILQERLSGAYTRIMVSPTGLLTFVLGKTIPFMLINLVQAVFMFALGVFVLPRLGCPDLIISNIPGLALVTIAISLVAVGFGLFMASFSETEFLAASISASVLIIMSAVGGIMVPKFVMPEFMRDMSLFVPHGWALDAYLDILVRNKGTAEVLPEIGILLLFAALFFGVAIVRMARQDRS